ncbi:MAG: hypothetical protein ACQEQV_10640 [Fibrobacterota bacterium]
MKNLIYIFLVLMLFFFIVDRTVVVFTVQRAYRDRKQSGRGGVPEQNQSEDAVHPDVPRPVLGSQ